MFVDAAGYSPAQQLNLTIMKKVLLSLAIITGLASCKSGKEDLATEKQMLPVNPVGFSGSVLTDTAKIIAPVAAPEEEVIIYKKRKKVIYIDEPVVVKQPTVTPVPAETSATPPIATQPTVPSTGTDTNTGSGNTDANTGTAGTGETEKKKKGWSNAAKGAVIGGVGGAVAGAVINGKNRGKGAVIGGVIGAAGGYILGKKKDKNATELYDNK
mgnify:CR=1 FL=1